MDTTKPQRRGTRFLLAIGLLFLSPMFAEYIIGYDNNTGNLPELAAGLLILGPLYGAPALLIRELARRYGVRWPGILALAGALGIIQAGVIDQSLFSQSYRQIDYWEEMIRPTWIEPLGLSVDAGLNFVLGHVIWSFCIPIALVENMCPELSHQPWLRRTGLIITTLLYLAAAWLILDEHLWTEQDHASTAQVIGSLAVAAMLVVVAFTAGRRQPPPPLDLTVPKPLVIVVLSLFAALSLDFLPNSWPGDAGKIAVLVGSFLVVARLSRSQRWGPRHVVALATGALMTRAISAFLIVPLGDVPLTAKYAHNTFFLLGAAILGGWIIWRNRPRPESSLHSATVPAG